MNADEEYKCGSETAHTLAVRNAGWIKNVLLPGADDDGESTDLSGQTGMVEHVGHNGVRKSGQSAGLMTVRELLGWFHDLARRCF